MNKTENILEHVENIDLNFETPKLSDLESVEQILKQWNSEEDTIKYRDRIKSEIEGKTEFGMHFWLAKENEAVVGVGGLADPLPKILSYAKTENPGELKILYFDNQARGKGFGTKFLHFLEEQSISQGRTEMLVRSAEEYRETAYEFYKNCGYEDMGSLPDTTNQAMEIFRKDLQK